METRQPRPLPDAGPRRPVRAQPAGTRPAQRPSGGSDSRASATAAPRGQRPCREGPGAAAARLPPPPDGLESTRRPRPPRLLPHESPAAHRARRPPSRAHLLPRRPARAVGSACAPRFPLGLSRAGVASRARARRRRRRLLLLAGGRRRLGGAGPPPGRKRPPGHRLPGAAIPLRRPPPRLSPSGSAFLSGRVSRARGGRGRGTGRGGGRRGEGQGDGGAGRARGGGHGTKERPCWAAGSAATSAAPPSFAAEGEREDFAWPCSP